MNKAAATDWRQVRPHCDSCARTFCGSHRQCTSLQARDRSLKEEFGRWSHRSLVLDRWYRTASSWSRRSFWSRNLILSCHLYRIEGSHTLNWIFPVQQKVFGSSKELRYDECLGWNGRARTLATRTVLQIQVTDSGQNRVPPAQTQHNWPNQMKWLFTPFNYDLSSDQGHGQS
jgi:hypothetical protein